MTATLNASAPDPAAPTPVPTAAAPLRPRWELPSLAVLLLGTGGDLPLEPVRLRLGQHVLRRGRAGRDAELDGVLLRLARLRPTRSPSTSRPPRCG